jgi:hypothetical protein
MELLFRASARLPPICHGHHGQEHLTSRFLRIFKEERLYADYYESGYEPVRVGGQSLDLVLSSDLLG